MGILGQVKQTLVTTGEKEGRAHHSGPKLRVSAVIFLPSNEN